jgi:hypothetical protein
VEQEEEVEEPVLRPLESLLRSVHSNWKGRDQLGQKHSFRTTSLKSR